MGTPPRLAGLAEVAELLGVAKRSASRYTRRDDFPQPIARLSTGPVWDADAVEVWGVELAVSWRGASPDCSDLQCFSCAREDSNLRPAD